MIVAVDYTEKLRAAYEAGAAAMMMAMVAKGEKPDFEKWLESQKHPPIVRG